MNTIPMLTLNGLLMNTFMGNAYLNKDTGESTPARLKIQMMCDVPQKSGGVKKELVTLSLRDDSMIETYENFQGKNIRVAVGVIPDGRNLNYWILPFTTPELVDLSASAAPSAPSAPSAPVPAAPVPSDKPSGASAVKSPLG